VEAGQLDRVARARSRYRFLAGLALAALAAVALLRWSEQRRELHAAHPPQVGRVVAAGLEAPLVVLRDRRGVPHVRAESERDAWFALGFAHAQDRLTQMAWLRRVATGRTAEWVGAEGLPADRLARTVDFAGLARRDLARQGARARRTLEAYAAGVNARLARLRDREAEAPLGLPEPAAAIEPWAPEDSLAILKLHAWAYGSGLDEVIVLEAIVRRLGATAARAFFPRWVGRDAVAPPAEPAPPASAARHPARPAPLGAAAVAPLGVAAVAPLRRAAGLVGSSLGSSAFVVAGSLAKRGRPLLAADAHLPPRFPAHFYQADVAGGPLHVAGATLPGVPAFWTGFNPWLAWAATGAGAVVADLFEETLHASDPSRYAEGSGWRSLARREESLTVRGAEPETLVVRSTPRGPLVDDLLAGVGRPLSLRWVGALPGNGIEGLLRLAHARDGDDVAAALARHHEPALVVTWAARDGSGGIQLAGSLPRRRTAAGLQPVPARNPAFAWTETLPATALPGRALGSERRWLVAADRSLAPRAGGIEYFWLEGDRAVRIERMIRDAASAGPIELSGLGRMLGDRHAGAAGSLLALALDHAPANKRSSREEREVVAALGAWDGDSSRASAGAAIYQVFVARLLRALFEPTLGAELLERYLALPRVNAAALARSALRDAAGGGSPEAPWTEPDFVRHAVRTSLREAWVALSVELGTNDERWALGRLKTLRFEPLWRDAWLGDRDALGPFPYAGDPSSVAVAEHAPLGPWQSRVVSSWRFVVDAGNLDQALTALAPGQSEHAGHANATDGIAPWIADRLSLLSTSDPVIEDGPTHRLQLVPRE
jgi:penicillin amidase